MIEIQRKKNHVEKKNEREKDVMTVLLCSGIAC